MNKCVLNLKFIFVHKKESEVILTVFHAQDMKRQQSHRSIDIKLTIKKHFDFYLSIFVVMFAYNVEIFHTTSRMVKDRLKINSNEFSFLLAYH